MVDRKKYPYALPKGSSLMGRYVIEEVLGQGGFGITYRAREHRTSEEVAIKEFFPRDACEEGECYDRAGIFSGQGGVFQGRSCRLP